MKKCGFTGVLAVIILIIGGLNWGLVGAFNFNLVEYLFGSMPMVIKIIYIVVGLAAIIKLFMMLKHIGHHEAE